MESYLFIWCACQENACLKRIRPIHTHLMCASWMRKTTKRMRALSACLRRMRDWDARVVACYFRSYALAHFIVTSHTLAQLSISLFSSGEWLLVTWLWNYCVFLLTLFSPFIVHFGEDSTLEAFYTGTYYNCPNNCGKRYKHRASVSNHFRFECGLAPQFVCKYCDKKCARKYTLKSHMLSVHKKFSTL